MGPLEAKLRATGEARMSKGGFLSWMYWFDETDFEFVCAAAGDWEEEFLTTSDIDVDVLSYAIEAAEALGL